MFIHEHTCHLDIKRPKSLTYGESMNYSAINAEKSTILSMYFTKSGGLTVSIGAPAVDPKFWSDQDKTKQATFSIPQESIAYWNAMNSLHGLLVDEDEPTIEVVEPRKLVSKRRYLTTVDMNGVKKVSGYKNKVFTITKEDITISSQTFKTLNDTRYDMGTRLGEEHFVAVTDDTYTYKLSDTKLNSEHVNDVANVPSGVLALCSISDIIKNALVLSDTAKQQKNSYKQNSSYNNSNNYNNNNYNSGGKVQYNKYTGSTSDNYNWFVDHTNNNATFRWTKNNGQFVKVYMHLQPTQQPMQHQQQQQQPIQHQQQPMVGNQDQTLPPRSVSTENLFPGF